MLRYGSKLQMGQVKLSSSSETKTWNHRDFNHFICLFVFFPIYLLWSTALLFGKGRKSVSLLTQGQIIKIVGSSRNSRAWFLCQLIITPKIVRSKETKRSSVLWITRCACNRISHGWPRPSRICLASGLHSLCKWAKLNGSHFRPYSVCQESWPPTS